MKESGSHQGFTELLVWKKARIFKNEISTLVASFPREEKFRLSDQLIRSSRSVTASIAEGHGRFSYKDRLHFCIIARGSLSETLCHLIDAFDCKFITAEKLIHFKTMYNEIERILNGYIAFLRKNVTT